MKAAYLEKTGPPDVFIYGDLPDPEPGRGEVLIAVEYASINHRDTIVRSGTRAYFSISPPHVLGAEMVGSVVSIGAGVTAIAAGDRVVARAKNGSYASLAIADASHTFALPESVSARTAIGFGVSAPTAYRILMRRAELKAGQHVLVTAAASGVGTLLVQIAKAAGCSVIGTAGSDAKRARVLELGADVVIDHYNDDIEAAVSETTEGLGVHAVVDAVSDQRLFDAAFKSIRAGGKYVSYGNIAGSSLNFNVTALFGKGIEIRGLHGDPRLEATEHVEDVAAVIELGAKGRLSTIIDHTRPLSEAGEAHRLMEEGNLIGKIALVP